MYGFDWNNGGPGAADLALNILEAVRISAELPGGAMLACCQGQVSELSWDLHQLFKWRVLACLSGRQVVIPYEVVVLYLKTKGKNINLRRSYVQHVYPHLR